MFLAHPVVEKFLLTATQCFSCVYRSVLSSSAPAVCDGWGDFHTCVSISVRLWSPAEKWYKRHLTYQIVNWPRHLSLGSVRLAVHAAFQLWSNVSGLVFQEAPEGPADIRLAFYEGDHNDGASNAFDGPGEGQPHAEPLCAHSNQITVSRALSDNSMLTQ